MRVERVSRLTGMSLLLSTLWAPALTAAGAGVEVGELQITPTFAARTQSDGNSVDTNQDELKSWVNLVDAGMALRFTKSKASWEVGYRAAAADHDLNEDSDYLDHFFSGNGTLHIGKRHALRVQANLDVAHTDAGKSRSKVASKALGELDMFARKEVGVTYSFGASSSDEPFSAEISYTDLRYEDQQASRHQTRYSEDFVSSTLLWQALPGSTFLVELSHLEVGHGDEDARIESDNRSSNRVFTGYKWQSSQHTSGVLKLGYLRQDFDTQGREPFIAPSWEVKIEWSPHERSKVILESQRLDKEAAAGSDLIDTRRYGIHWTQAWDDEWSLQIAGTYLDEVYTLADQTLDTVHIDTSLHYLQRRGVQWTLGYRWRDRDSNIEHLRLGRNEVELSATIPL